MDVAESYTAKWSDGVVAYYDTLSEIVADIITQAAEAEDWKRVLHWAELMESGEFKDYSEEAAIKAILSDESDIEDIVAQYGEDAHKEFGKLLDELTKESTK